MNVRPLQTVRGKRPLVVERGKENGTPEINMAVLYSLRDEAGTVMEAWECHMPPSSMAAAVKLPDHRDTTG
ncbi:hypothetical protein Pmani_040194 [Petrolisthes manimaculis]|uniref:Uncharacterized protein n=1 Tax=Petrolisthes manimaculis TaxID=1843537 RepID=A0AAE1TKI6_9EUCA|nr:hypothetical protein Pmani_040194 [Petrolisthes manimaculis]